MDTVPGKLQQQINNIFLSRSAELSLSVKIAIINIVGCILLYKKQSSSVLHLYITMPVIYIIDRSILCCGYEYKTPDTVIYH